jgi:hypothetical protein
MLNWHRLCRPKIILFSVCMHEHTNVQILYLLKGYPHSLLCWYDDFHISAEILSNIFCSLLKSSTTSVLCCKVIQFYPFPYVSLLKGYISILFLLRGYPVSYSMYLYSTVIFLFHFCWQVIQFPMHLYLSVFLASSWWRVNRLNRSYVT